MGNADAHSRRGNKSDFYITPFPCVRALLDRIDLRNKTILDPCSGTGVIGKVVREYGYDLTEYEITKGTDFFQQRGTYDIIIANPPYSIKDEFITRAILKAGDVYMILPLNVCNYNSFHKRYLAKEYFMGKYLMTPKFFMTDKETENPKRGGISAYAWFHWSIMKMDMLGLQSYERYINLNEYFRAER